MCLDLRSRNSVDEGFFLMEVLIIVVVFMSFSLVLLGWYSHFSLQKLKIIKRGQAIFIASSALELMKIRREILNNVDCPEGFNISVIRGPVYSHGFAEVTVSVSFHEGLNPISLSTGISLVKDSVQLYASGISLKEVYE